MIGSDPETFTRCMYLRKQVQDELGIVSKKRHQALANDVYHLEP